MSRILWSLHAAPRSIIMVAIDFGPFPPAADGRQAGGQQGKGEAAPGVNEQIVHDGGGAPLSPINYNN